MKTRMTVSLGLSALIVGGTMVGCTAGGGQGIASASDRSVAVADQQAAVNAAKADKALGKHDAADAVRYAEAAVQLSPRDAGYRMILAQSYLQAGRFVSARQAYSDVLELVPDDHAVVGKAALNLALAETAAGDWATARKTLDDHATDIPVGDLGLALALAGNPAGGVAILTQAARSDQSDAKLRQNLALSFALAGNWNAARVTAAVDMSPADVDARLAQWATFAQPQRASDQVASLLRVTPVADQGQPMALALNASVPMGVAVAPVAVAEVSQPEPAAAPEMVAAVAPVSAPTSVVFGPSHEVVQALPVRLIRADARATKVAVAAVKVATPVAVVAPKTEWAKGEWFVQFGAYDNAAVAHDGWGRIQRRYAALGDLNPTGMNFTSKAGSFYRLSVGGFARADADRLCRMVRAKGGNCFVRKDAGDRIAQWLAPKNTQVASR
ncbi:SPOR domain-containing protein [Sphingomonas oligophenolica]|uniref:SPOR domain-containing protein n=1 Tax=Sphingomonas oligophenolica TaxID=301154 RepID=A0A502CI40_9SPHN|nr:SPOR domain-containing protein [Sphingomonas oligophenolica]TPG12648.1 SPOR domain-containing protein [Sphingomonas oligophenolica]